jgi:UDP-glucose 4-epimerase
MTRSALVTGGAGFIGSHLVDGLLAAGWRVRLLDDFSSGREANVAHLDGSAELLRGDLRDRALLDRALAGVEVVFHEGAVPSVPRSVAEPERTHSVNATGTLGVLEASRVAGVRRVVFASSSSAYGDTPVLPKVETMPPCPLSPYALQKYAGERYCQLYHRLYGLETVALRYFNVYGPRQALSNPYTGVLAIFAARLLNGRPPLIFEDGLQSRDFVHVSDVVRANLLALASSTEEGRVYNVGTGRATTILRVAEELARQLGRDIAPDVPGRFRAGDVRHCIADVALSGRELGYAPRIAFEEGLKDLLEWLARQAPEDRVDEATRELEQRGLAR